MKNVPTLRFKEFSSEWQAQKLGDFSAFSKGKGISKADIDPNGINPCIRYGELYTVYGEKIDNVLSKTNVDIKNLVVSEVNDIIIPASGETQIDIAKASCVLKSGIALGGDLNIIKTNKNGVFLSYYLNSKKKLDIAKLAQGKSVVHLYPSQLEKLDVNTPSDKEQTKIADFLTAIDDRISQLSQKCDGLAQYKKGVMQKIFSQELRFKDEKGRAFPAWNKDNLLNLSEEGFTNGVFNDPKKTGRGYKLINVLDMYIDSTIDEEKLSLVELSDAEFKKNKVEHGEVFFTRSSLVKSGIAYSNIYLGNSQDITFDGHLIRMRPRKDLINSIFLNYLLRTPEVRKQLVARGKTATMTTIGQTDIAAVIVAFPSMAEQEKIAGFLWALDEKISHAQAQRDVLKQYKQGLLQQMFV